MKIFYRTLLVFVAAFTLNLIWEHLHSALYVSYQGGAITNLILLRAALFDAAVIALFSYPFLHLQVLKRRRWMMYLTLIIFAIVLEKWALMTGRWAYTSAMPIIPILNIGLTPAVQLGMLGYFSNKVSDFVKTRMR